MVMATVIVPAITWAGVDLTLGPYQNQDRECDIYIGIGFEFANEGKLTTQFVASIKEDQTPIKLTQDTEEAFYQINQKKQVRVTGVSPEGNSIEAELHFSGNKLKWYKAVRVHREDGDLFNAVKKCQNLESVRLGPTERQIPIIKRLNTP